MNPRITELIQKEIKTILKEFDKPNDASFLPDDVKKKMKDVIAVRINNKALQLAEWAVNNDGESIDKFFLTLIELVNKKYGKYIDPEKFTPAEKEAISKFELLSKRNIKLTDYAASYISKEQGTWWIYKNLYSDGKSLAYFVARDGKIVAKSKKFQIEKKQSLRELLSLIKSVWQY